MLIKLILISAIVVISLLLMKSRVSERNTAMRRLGIVTFALLAVVSVIYPALTSQVARLVGVHRGTDLLLYLFIIAFLASLMTAAKQRSKLDHKLTKLARAQALGAVILPRPAAGTGAPAAEANPTPPNAALSAASENADSPDYPDAPDSPRPAGG